MRNKYITATLLALLSAGAEGQAQDTGNAPRLVVNIAIDQLRTDYLESFEPLYSNDGFRKIMQGGLLYTNAQYPFAPIDRASAIAALNTGTTPNNNGIVSEQWFDRSSLRPVSCVDDAAFSGLLTQETASAQSVMTTTLSDELKVGTKGKAFIYSIAERKDAAVIPAGHNGDGAFWVNSRENCWCTSTYYSRKAPKWLEAYNLYNTPYKKNSNINEQITDLALKCISANSMGKDEATDMLFITYNAAPQIDKNGYEDCKEVYLRIDQYLGRLINDLRTNVGLDKVLFVVTGTGYYNELKASDKNYRLPGGTIFINRTANLLNMYLGALYGSDKYVEGYMNNQIFLNTKLLDKKRLNLQEITEISKTFVRQCQGVGNAFSADNIMSTYSPEQDKARKGFYLSRCGDIMIEAAPGWNIINEDTQQQISQNYNYLQTPIIFYGPNIKGEKITTPVTVEKVSPTIAKTIRIRAPNGCKEAPLF